MPLRALVIDDEYSGRKKKYDRLAFDDDIQVLELESAEIPFRIDQIEKAVERAQLVLLDIFLDSDRGVPFEIPGRVNVLERLAKARPELPIYLVSDLWDKVNLDVYEGLVRIRQIAGGMTLARLEDPAECQQLRHDIVRTVREAWGIAEFSGGPSDDLTILQLSDLQCGGEWVHDDAERLVQDVLNALPRQGGHPQTPDLLAITGDVAERGEPREFQMGFRFLEMLRERLEIPRQNCFVVPGNHDVSLPLSCSHLVEYSPDTSFDLEAKPPNPQLVAQETARGLNRFGLAPFQDFCRAFTGRNDWQLDYRLDVEPVTLPWFRSGLFVPYGLHILCLNTVALLGPGNHSRASMPRETNVALQRDLDTFRQQQPEPDKIVHLVLLHHSPWPGIGKETLEDAGYLLHQLAKRGDCIFLFGHVHETLSGIRGFVDNARDQPRQAVYAVASTPALRADQRSEDTIRGFNLIRIQRQDDTVTGLEVRHYERHKFDFREAAEPTAFDRDPEYRMGWSIRRS